MLESPKNWPFCACKMHTSVLKIIAADKDCNKSGVLIKKSGIQCTLPLCYLMLDSCLVEFNDPPQLWEISYGLKSYT